MRVQGRGETYTKKLYGNENNFQKHKTKNKMVLKRTSVFGSLLLKIEIQELLPPMSFFFFLSTVEIVKKDQSPTEKKPNEST